MLSCVIPCYPSHPTVLAWPLLASPSCLKLLSIPFKSCLSCFRQVQLFSIVNVCVCPRNHHRSDDNMISRQSMFEPPSMHEPLLSYMGNCLSLNPKYLLILLASLERNGLLIPEENYFPSNFYSSQCERTPPQLFFQPFLVSFSCITIPQAWCVEAL